MIILGISGTTNWIPSDEDDSNFLHGSSASLVIDGKYIGSVEEERFSRIKYDGSFPKNSIDQLLNKNNLTYDEVDVVVHAGGGAKTYYEQIKNGTIKTFFKNIFKNAEIIIFDHHLAHAATSILTSNFEECNILSLDSGGNIYPVGILDEKVLFEYNRGFFGLANKQDLSIDKLHNYFGDFKIGPFFANISMILMRRINNLPTEGFFYPKEAEKSPGKIMGLSAYGNHKNVKIDKESLYLLRTNHTANDFSVPFINGIIYDKKFEKYSPEDIASWAQKVFEDVIVEYLGSVPKRFKSDYLCFSGGCALNILLNTKMIESGLYKDVHIPTAPNDSGLSLGAALYVAKQKEKEIILPKNLGCVGLSYDNKEVVSTLEKHKNELIYKQYEYKEVYEIISQNLKDNKIVAWHQGKSEYGPRALGNRSIFANPSFDNKQLLNEKVKFREHWRPYAAIVMEEHLEEWFNIPKKDSHYMLFNSIVREEKRQLLKSATHVDNSCRIQTVNEDINDKAYNLLKHFKEKTGIPVLLNTSFNTIPEEPIVETPSDAINSFLYSKIDYLVMNNFIITKNREICLH